MLTLLQALEFSIARERAGDPSDAPRQQMLEALQSVVVEECERLHRAGGAIPETLASVPC